MRDNERDALVALAADLHEYADGCNAPYLKGIAYRIKALAALIDSAGGARGITGSVSPQMRDANACTPQPAEGDGAVGKHVRHVGGGLLALYNGDEQIREIGVTPGWDFKDRDEFIVRYNTYTRPSAAAAVPDGWRIVPCKTDARMLDAAFMEFPQFRCDDEIDAIWDAMLAAAPAAPKGGDGAIRRAYQAAFLRQGHSDDLLASLERDVDAALATGEQP